MTIANLNGTGLMSTDVSASGGKRDSKSSASFSDVINLAGSRSVDTSQNNANQVKTADSKTANDTKVSKASSDNGVKSQKDTNKSDKADNKDNVSMNDGKTKISDSAKDGRNVKNTDDSVSDKDVTQGADEDAIASAIEAITSAIEQIQTLIQNVLGISKEELDSTMQALDMVPEDLLDGENILKVVMTTNELSSTMELISNEDLSMDVKELMNQINQAKEQLGVTDITPEQAKAEVMVFEQAVVTEEDDADVTVESETQVVSDVKVTVEVESDNLNNHTKDDQSQGPKEHSHVNNQHVNTTATQNVFTELAQAVTQTTSYTSATSAQAVDIINQIVDEIRTVVKADTTSMELQLNPASLGKVHIQVAAKEGVITASITAETQAARNAIEGQIAVLKESFNNQGLKVEAVEVTINPEGFNEFNEQQAFEGEESNESGKNGSKRQINLDDLDIDDAELTEEEAINVDMMRRSGNSVDFTA